ncbi:alpha/beta hydrolase [Streptococcus chenjunshii]|uniref:Alpha/beta hydrolase n=1 Tax=Streptococcus chenjunshii TaxID=2173853 RepID=A0A372KKZ2_9STRE|nr:alpha/beta fold hydrolase [Streptococcus chenjunshii]AXQ79187.1 alpha/beta hydrolase [Streptococcus chenjunshii]RFU50759.1 alpha/beta hydrolase [Streptococcus chenjunshii]RFU52940.1 alpha/beta hydrolase [Streptococcus chenjunshii]
MKAGSELLKRQQTPIHFRNKDMDFMLNWSLGISQLIGMSPGEILLIAQKIRNGQPQDWESGFKQHAHYLAEQARRSLEKGYCRTASQQYFGACYALKAALQFSDPRLPDYQSNYDRMEEYFSKGSHLANLPLQEITIPYQNTHLPGYYLKSRREKQPTLLVIGGGDTGRADLFYFLGQKAFQADYNVLMVDLPGQGINPARNLTFTVDAGQAVSAVLDWYDAPSGAIALAGLSGGGYFTAQAVEKDKRIKAWIASTPIYDIKAVFQHSFGRLSALPNPVLQFAGSLLSSVSAVTAVQLKKYAWQFGTENFSQAVKEVLKQAYTVNIDKISVPSLFLAGKGEDAELIRQAKVLAQNLSARDIPAALKEFDSLSGADAHCQVNNLRLMNHIVLDWLDMTFKNR